MSNRNGTTGKAFSLAQLLVIRSVLFSHVERFAKRVMYTTALCHLSTTCSAFDPIACLLRVFGGLACFSELLCGCVNICAYCALCCKVEKQVTLGVSQRTQSRWIKDGLGCLLRIHQHHYQLALLQYSTTNSKRVLCCGLSRD